MELSQGNQCVTILNKQNVHFFTKMENRRAEQVLYGPYQWEGGRRARGCRKMTLVQIQGTHVCKSKNEIC
jgi:hypothetical protein